MKLRNVVSGKVGEVRADDHDATKVDHSAIWCVPIRRRLPNGQYTYSYWRLHNLEET